MKDTNPTYDEIRKFQKEILSMCYLVGWYTCEQILKEGKRDETLEYYKNLK